MACVDCLQCGGSPERRHQPGSGLFLWVCAVCSNRGEVHPSESRALASWNLVNDPELPPHTCKGKGVARFFIRSASWGSRCPCCDFVDEGYATIEGARAGWARAVR